MSPWIIAILVVAGASGLGMTTVLLNKKLDQVSRTRWLLTLAVFEGVVISGLVAMWVLTGMD